MRTISKHYNKQVNDLPIHIFFSRRIRPYQFSSKAQTRTADTFNQPNLYLLYCPAGGRLCRPTLMNYGMSKPAIAALGGHPRKIPTLFKGIPAAWKKVLKSFCGCCLPAMPKVLTWLRSIVTSCGNSKPLGTMTDLTSRNPNCPWRFSARCELYIVALFN